MSRIISICLFLILNYSVLSVDSYKILVICSAPTRSHYNLAKAVADIMHERGHEITLISAFKPASNDYKNIAITDLLSYAVAKQYKITMKERISFLGMLRGVKKVIEETYYQTITHILDNPEVKLLMDNSKFDLVIIDYYNNEALLGLSVQFDCPVVMISPKSPLPTLANLINNPVSPATNPNTLFPATMNMNFKERALNFLFITIERFFAYYLHNPIQEMLYNKYFPNGSKIVKYSQLNEKISLTLINYHPSLGDSRLLYSNAVYIGGYHILNKEPLPKDLQHIMDSAENGIVYFSMGSNLRTANIDTNIINVIINSLSKINATFLWKYEDELKDLPKNIITRKWLPQQSILDHPHTKLFITQAGVLSCIEAAHFGVPVVAIPVISDQGYNARAIAERGTGVIIKNTNITETSLTEAILEVLKNEKYKVKAKEFQKIFLDRPIPPQKLVYHYIEHVIRTKGASYLQPPKIGLFQELLLDIIFVFIILPSIALLIALFILYRLIKVCLRKLIGKEQKLKSM